jgi:hypothetical protein
VARTLTSKRSSLLFVVVVTACGGGGGLETATEMPKSPRRPDGVALEQPPAMPSAADRAPAIGVVALREPLADKEVEDIVRSYLRAFESENEKALEVLLATEAAPLGRPGTNRVHLAELWRTKMRNFEYQRLAGVEVARISQIEKHSYDLLGQPGSLPRPPEMKPGDLYVRVPIVTPRIGSEQLFGDILVLLLRREDGRWKIAGQADENTN